jgi:hypothetical protein
MDSFAAEGFNNLLSVLKDFECTESTVALGRKMLN